MPVEIIRSEQKTKEKIEELLELATELYDYTENLKKSLEELLGKKNENDSKY